MSLSSSVGQTWEAASAPGAVQAAKRYESALLANPSHPPDPYAFLPEPPEVRPAALLAILRVKLAHEFTANHGFRVESLIDQYAEMNRDSLTALLYEEYCLREEAGEAVDPDEYYERFPLLTEPLKRVLSIHELVGAASSGDLPGESVLIGKRGEPELPSAGQTIGGFHLVEELGRGSFARVFRAEERQLANRPVALKVTRRGTREPQLLARLQHTHIVPIHSYQNDKTSDLHLLCMPYYGRVTLARLLKEPDFKSARSGGDFLGILDRVGAEDARRGWVARALDRETIASLSFARATAWWCARIAEALHHAHGLGVMHRDLKPSNILITPDGVPMLLDFNLAREPPADISGEIAPLGTLGGTLAYMAPEEIDDLASGLSTRNDPRGDIYSLGVVLFETLAGRRPFDSSQKATGEGFLEVLEAIATDRRRTPPSLRAFCPEVPRSLDAIAKKCLAPDPEQRYGSAKALAEDLQAAADDHPLRHATEPAHRRVLGWAWRKRSLLAVAAVLLALVTGGAVASRQQSRVRNDFESEIRGGDRSYENLDFASALEHYDKARDVARLPVLFDVRDRRRIESRILRARAARVAHDVVAELFAKFESYRYPLLSSDSPNVAVVEETQAFVAAIRRRLGTNLSLLKLLSAEIRTQAASEIADLEFLCAANYGRMNQYRFSQLALEITKTAIAAAPNPEPFVALGEVLEERMGFGRKGGPTTKIQPASESSGMVCLEWAILRILEGDKPGAANWLMRALAIDPGDAWSNYYLGEMYAGRPNQFYQAYSHFSAAILMRPRLFWPRYARGQLYASKGLYSYAAQDLDNAVALCLPGKPPSELRLNRAIVHQAMGEFTAARRIYEDLLANPAESDKVRKAAYADLAALEYSAGAPGRAESLLLHLTEVSPGDPETELALVKLDDRKGCWRTAEARLIRMIEANPKVAGRRALLARERILLGNPSAAVADALEAYRIQPGDAELRLLLRALISAHRLDLPPIDDPAALDDSPLPGLGLTRDIRLTLAANPENGTTDRLLNRALLFAALGSRQALGCSARAVAAEPGSRRAIAIHARILARFRRRRDAIETARSAGAIDRSDPRGPILLGELLLDFGRSEEALAQFDAAITLHAGDSVRLDRGRALLARGDPESALADFSIYTSAFPEDPRSHLMRSEALLALKRYGDAAAALEFALNASDESLAILAKAELLYIELGVQSGAWTERPYSLAKRVLAELRREYGWFWRQRDQAAQSAPQIIDN